MARYHSVVVLQVRGDQRTPEANTRPIGVVFTGIRDVPPVLLGSKNELDLDLGQGGGSP